MLLATCLFVCAIAETALSAIISATSVRAPYALGLPQVQASVDQADQLRQEVTSSPSCVLVESTTS